MQPSATLVFFGNERLSSSFTPTGAPTLTALLNAGYKVAAVVSHYQAGQSRRTRALEIEAVARAHNIPVLLPEKPKDIIEQLRSYRADAGVLVAYGKIIPESVIKIFPHGILNIHPSLLPHYRGSTPIEQAILDGAHETGVSVMGLVKAMDAGPIYAQDRLPLRGDEAKFELTQTLLERGSRLLVKILPDVLSGAFLGTEQDETQATFTKQLLKSSGKMDLQKPAELLEREVRAYFGWPKSSISIFGQEVIVRKARVAQNENDGKLLLVCNPGWLEVLELIAPSGRTMSGEAFLRGYAQQHR